MRESFARRLASFAFAAALALVAPASSSHAQVVDTVRHTPAQHMDWGRETFVLSEVLEYAPKVADRALNYDLVGWTGGAVNRLWVKVDGGVATRSGARDGEYQLLYGRLVAPLWDAQVGIRVDERAESATSVSRVGAVIGLQGLAPGWFELEPSLFISSEGRASIDLTASYDLFLTQIIVLQPRIESSLALADDANFGVGSGMSSTSFGLRTRIELRREFAPYIGIVWDRRYGQTASLARAAGEAVSEQRVVAGLRLWR